MTGRAAIVAWAACAALATQGGCDRTDGLAVVDAGADGPTQLTLTINLVAPTLPDLVITQGELELERLGIFGNAGYDQRNEIARLYLDLDGGPQQFVFADASFGLYSRVRSEVDHVLIEGSWRGVPLLIDSMGDERIVDLRGADQELSPTQSAQFELDVDGTGWLDAATLDTIVPDEGVLKVDIVHAPDVIDALVSNVSTSFQLLPP